MSSFGSLLREKSVTTFPFISVIVLTVGLSIPALGGDRPAPKKIDLFDAPLDLTIQKQRKAAVRMPGEFEHQEMVVFSCGELDENFADMLAEITGSIRGGIRVAILYSDDEQHRVMKTALKRRMNKFENVALIYMPHDTRWVRDYGPTSLECKTGFRMIDWMYGEDRPSDEQVPAGLSELSHTYCENADIVLAGGNLISNGRGLSLTTSAFHVSNIHLGLTDDELEKKVATRIGAKQLVVLEPLLGESTGHIDMFATFTDSRTVVIGEYSMEDDPENAAILDRNAARLAALNLPDGPLNVVRIPMGSKIDGVFRTYTNCIFANGVLVVPSYSELPDGSLQEAKDCFGRLLPGWRIVHQDCSELILTGGALHCVSLNIPGTGQKANPLPLPIQHAKNTLEILDIDDGLFRGMIPHVVQPIITSTNAYEDQRKPPSPLSVSFQNEQSFNISSGRWQSIESEYNFNLK